MEKPLSKLSELRDSEFGQPCPRHGLKLLYWFAHDYVDFDDYGQIAPKNPKATPETGAYGFREFHNSPVNGAYLLPEQSLPYYKVGNLKRMRRRMRTKLWLPKYVRQDYNGGQYKRNMDRNKDRIIVRLNAGYLDMVYITEHTDKIHFSRARQISPGLIKHIRKFKAVEDFLQMMKAPLNENPVEPPKKTSYEKRPRPPKNDCCIIL